MKISLQLKKNAKNELLSEYCGVSLMHEARLRLASTFGGDANATPSSDYKNPVELLVSPSFSNHLSRVKMQVATLITSPPPILGYALMAIGALKATEHVLGFLRGVWKHCLRPRRWLKSRYARSGVQPWVVISGKSNDLFHFRYHRNSSRFEKNQSILKRKCHTLFLSLRD